ncbi:universal stress protein [Nocardioides mangrovi]|uniref:Universal stress protein n=1 Tax=Nocardioides mangrovi TaxID=2874580 RepID=A0ABS7UJQ5_9ACTN|nr:universal stress protein [Nocardioides mangrovi]MBZ5741226.1 universal stress protein [Nocardioides mangrovi]
MTVGRSPEESVAGTIVAAVDGSDHALRALTWAVEEARAEGRRLTLVAAGDDARAVATAAVARVRELAPELAIDALISGDDPRQVLTDLSARAHLLVVGSRGRGPVSSMLLGSVSAYVVAHAACPVVVCRPDEHPRPRGRGVLVGADGTPESRPVLDFGYRQAALHGLPLTVRHCFWDAVAAAALYHRSRGEDVDAPDLTELEAMLAESIAGYAETYPEVEVTLSLDHGLVDEALTPRGQTWDLVVVGRHPMTSLSRVVIGSIATSVVERAHTTVAVVPEEPS